MTRVAVFGTGYVGCVSAACLARDGHRVIGVDIDTEKVAMINDGVAPVSEPGLNELLQSQVAGGALVATVDVEEAVRQSELALITVGTPSREDGSVGTEAVNHVMSGIGKVLRQSGQEYAVVVRSTLLPGILENELAPRLAESAGCELGPGLRIANNPEFLRESSAIQDYDQAPFVVVGVVDEWDAKPVLELYQGITAEQIVTDARSAAMIKYACNAFHATKVAFANEIGALTKSFGGDGRRVMELLCRDTKLNISPAYLRPGFAFGGSCLPKDMRALVRHGQREAVRVDLLNAVLTSNAEHIQRAVRMVEQNGRRKVGLVGLSFKAGTDDLRESPQVILAETLLGRGYELKIYDPGVTVSRLRGRNRAYVDQHLPHLAALLVDEPEEIRRHAEILILATGVADAVPWHQQSTARIIDLRKDLVAEESRVESRESSA